MQFALFSIQQVRHHRIMSPIAEVAAGTSGEPNFTRFSCCVLHPVSSVRIEIIEFPLRSTREQVEGIKFKIRSSLSSDSGPRYPIVIFRPSEKMFYSESLEDALQIGLKIHHWYSF